MTTSTPEESETTKSPKNASRPAGPVKPEAPAEESGANVDKIRDILFGTHMRDYEKRFGRMEERVTREATELREEIKRRFASLEAFVKTELTALADQLRAEKSERGEADKELGREIKETARALEKKASQAEDQAAKALRDLREHVLNEAKRLTEELEAKHQAASTALAKESAELRAALTDRLALADLFAEVSLRLKDGFKIPPKK